MSYSNETDKKLEEMNVWTSIWYKPRETIRYAITKDLFTLAIILALVIGIYNFWNEFIISDSNYTLFTNTSVAGKALATLLIGPVFGIVSLLIMGGLVLLVGKLLGGRAAYRDVLIASGVAYIPTLLLFLLRLIEVSVFELIEQWSMGRVLLGLLLSFLTMVVGVWSLITFVKSISEAHQFSAWKGLGVFAIIIGVIILVVLVILLAIFSIFFF